MSEATLNKIKTLFENIDLHTSVVKQRMQQAGLRSNDYVDTVVTESVAKYWDALEKLAAE